MVTLSWKRVSVAPVSAGVVAVGVVAAAGGTGAAGMNRRPTRAIDRLISAGMVDRQTNPNSRREMRISLTV